MGEELQNLLEKIKRDGVDKANAEAAAILDKAKSDAAAIIKAAESKAAADKAAADKAAEISAARAEETIRQAARDTILKVEQAVTELLERLLANNIDAAMADPTVSAPIAAAAVQALVTGETVAEVAVNAKLAEALRAQLVATKGVTVVIDDSVQSGFSVRIDNGRVEHDFTGPAVAAALAARLRPELAKLVNLQS